MARSLPASPASDSSCSLPSTPKASREYFSKRQEASSSTPDGTSENKLLGKPCNPSPVPLGTPRLNFATTRQALTPRRALTSVKPISKATRSSRKSFWLGTGTLISDDEEPDGSFSNDTAVSQSADLVLTKGAEEVQRVFDDAEASGVCFEQQNEGSTDTDDEVMNQSSRTRLGKTRVIESESEEEEKREEVFDVGHQATMERQNGGPLAAGLCAPASVADEFEDDSEEEIIVNRRRGRRRIIVESDEEEEKQEVPLQDPINPNLPRNLLGVSTSASGQDEDLLAIIDRLYINDIASDDDEHGSGPRSDDLESCAKEIITISDSESSAELDGLDDYLLQYSPSPERRPIELPTTPSAPLKTATKKTPKAKGVRGKQKAWATERVRIAEELFDELDADVFKGRLRGAGAKLEWNTRLLTTAGTATDKTKRLPNGEVQHEFTIKLSTKVLDEAERILSTVAHEMCHLASWIINNEYSNPHGRVFQSWGRRVMRARPDIEVTTKHDYEIAYKYSWKCVDDECGKIYKRQSKSIDSNRHACGRCKSRLEPMFATKATSAFQDYLKVNMKNAKLALPGASFGDVMRELSARWKAGGIDHDSYWADRAAML